MDIRAMIDPSPQEPHGSIPQTDQMQNYNSRHTPQLHQSPSFLPQALSAYNNTIQRSPPAPYHQPYPQPESAFHQPMPYSPEQQKARIREKQHRRSVDKSGKSCKTCLYCRKRKTKCNSIRPSCDACTKLGKPCVYPDDSRSLPRPSVKEYQQMARKVAEIDNSTPRSLDLGRRPSSTPPNARTQPLDGAPDVSSPPPMNANGNGSELQLQRTTSGTLAGFRPASPYDAWLQHDHRRSLAEDSLGFRGTSCPPEDPIASDTRRDTAMDPIEVHELKARTGKLTSGSSRPQTDSGFLMTPPTRSTPLPDPILQIEQDLQRAVQSAATAQERLIANTSILKQQEERVLHSDLFRKVDLDGVDPELALHLLDLHWDGPHYSNLLTYRPVVVDSLIRNGPYMNRLLLNAIFFSSSILSDRPQVRTDPRLPGHMFYNQFRRLLIDEADRPSIPTATGCLLVGITLSASSQCSVGWMMCGIAYRMVAELGCQAAVEGRSSRAPKSPMHQLAIDVDSEMRKRLYYAAYMTDSQQSLYYGRAPAMQLPMEELCQPYLDAFEETEDYVPYKDPTKDSSFCLYEPRPGFAISTAQNMIRLARISSGLSKRLYSLETLHRTPEDILVMLESTQTELKLWHSALPQHLLFNPEQDATPAPHHMTPLLLYHALQILLHRPFVPGGPFEAHMTHATQAGKVDQSAAEEACINAAKSIKDIVEAYKAAFTLRYAPFIVMYCTYAAAVGLISTKARSKSRQTLGFFLTALQGCREGSNKTLSKPSAILRDIFTHYKSNNQETGRQSLSSAPKLERSLSDTDMAPALGPTSAPRSTSENEAGIRQDDVDRMDTSAIFVSSSGAQRSTSESPTTAAAYGPVEAADWPLNDPLYGILTAGLA